MKWFTHNILYEGFPLYMRWPDYQNFLMLVKRFPNLLCITHELENVKSNGLPESNYNKSLNQLDNSLIRLFDEDQTGIIILIETYCGNRNYWYYISADTNYDYKINSTIKKFPLPKIDVSCEKDVNWGFVESYPVKLYNHQ